MKIVIKLILFTALILTYSCKKQESVAYYNGGTQPALIGISNSGSSVINLSATDSAKQALSLNWTNPNYKSNYGVNTLGVNYLLEIDTAGSGFSNPKRAQITVSNDTSFVFSENLINGYLANQMGLDTSFEHNVEIRITATLSTTGTGAGTAVYSNVLAYTAKPFYPPPAVNPPSTGTLYLVGGPDIMNGSSWDNSNPFKSGYEFTKVSATFYTLTVALSGGDNTSGDNQFLFLPLAGDWGHKYACKKTTDQLESGGSFGYDFSSNFPGPSTGGTYKIDVDFQLGTYTIVKQ